MGLTSSLAGLVAPTLSWPRRLSGVEGERMPRIGTVIREVYRRPGADALPGHLEQRYGIRVTRVTRLHVSSRPVARTEADAEVLRFLERQEVPAERCAHAEPVSVLDGRAVLVTGYVPGQRPR